MWQVAGLLDGQSSFATRVVLTDPPNDGHGRTSLALRKRACLVRGTLVIVYRVAMDTVRCFCVILGKSIASSVRLSEGGFQRVCCLQEVAACPLSTLLSFFTRSVFSVPNFLPVIEPRGSSASPESRAGLALAVYGRDPNLPPPRRESLQGTSRRRQQVGTNGVMERGAPLLAQLRQGARMRVSTLSACNPRKSLVQRHQTCS